MQLELNVALHTEKCSKKAQNETTTRFDCINTLHEIHANPPIHHKKALCSTNSADKKCIVERREIKNDRMSDAVSVSSQKYRYL